MPALLKSALAVALALGLVAGGGALAASSNAVAQHATYVVMIEFIGAPDEDRVITGTVPCKLSVAQRMWSAFSGREPCVYPEYAYAFPADQAPPWEGDIAWVNDSYYVDTSGSIWHVAEVVYRVARNAPEGGEALVRAMASEVLPSQKDQGGLDVNFALPVNAALAGQGAAIIVGIGPAPPVTVA